MSDDPAFKVLLVIGGGIAAYKSCELVRMIRKGANGKRGDVTCVVTEGGQQFVTPMALAALSENEVFTSLFDLKNEAEMGHIQLSREADLVVVCPATANMLAKMSMGIADDLATTLILATDKPVMAVPAMNVRMWQHEATQRNVTWLRQAGVRVVDPDVGAMACGEFGPGRLPEPEMIWDEIATIFGIDSGVAPQADEEGGEAGEPSSIAYSARHDEHKGGLGGLLSSIIPRSLREDTPEEIAADMEAEDAQEAMEQAALDAGSAPDGPLLASKGGANSAPPTDPEAMNHTVATGAGSAEPQPLEGEVTGHGAHPSIGVHSTEDVIETPDPLDGQPAFEEEPEHRPLYGKHVLVTAGPTHEPIDPVRYLANRSSGRQGYAIAAAAAEAGAQVTLVSGPVTLATPPGVDRIDVESAQDMADAVKKVLPVDVAIMVAAVADWRTKDYASLKMKKRGSAPPALILTENPDILATLASGKNRPGLLIGFAAETNDVVENATTKRKRKGADWIVANDVSWSEGKSVMGGTLNDVHIVTSEGVEDLPEMPKEDVARALIERVAKALTEEPEAAYD